MNHLIKVQDLIRNKLAAVLDSEGRNVYAAMEEAVTGGADNLTISFLGVRHATYAFLHATIGRWLHGHPDWDQKLSTVDMETGLMQDMVKEVRNNALQAPYGIIKGFQNAPGAS